MMTARRISVPGAAFLIITRGPDSGARLPLLKAINSVGRHPSSDIFLDDVTVSRHHAEIRVTDGNDVEVIDIGSLHGTNVNRRRVEAARLNNGDEVEFGKFRLVFSSPKPPRPVSR